MFGKSMELDGKRDFMGAFMFYVAHLMFVVGVASVAVYFLGQAGFIESTGSFFEGGEVYTWIGSFFVLWLGGMMLHKRGMTNDFVSIAIVAVGVYLAYTYGVMMGLVPIALLTTMGK